MFRSVVTTGRIVGDPFARRKDYAATAYCPALPGLRPGAAGSVLPPEPVAPPLPLLPIGPLGATTGPLMSLPPMLVPVQLHPAMPSAIAPANSARPALWYVAFIFLFLLSGVGMPLPLHCCCPAGA